VAHSIHTTRRDLDDHLEDDYLDLDHKRDEARRLRARLAKKRRIKAQIAAERHRDPSPGPVVDPATIPILVEKPREHVHHGAAPEELVEVLRRLPPGVINGVTAIRLGLGLEHQARARDGHNGDPDPLTGRRPSLEMLPGVHSGQVLGIYLIDRAEIYLCAYVYEAQLPERRIKELYIKLRTLATLVHEFAHHHDHTARVARGRWRADETSQLEMYAERMEYTWMREVVIPYLEETHAAEVAFLREWLVRHGGADVPLAVLAEDPRLTRKDGMVGIAFSFRGALETLLEDVEAGRDPIDTRIRFARTIHYADEYAIPRAILAGVLAEQPLHAEAHTLLADIDVHEDRYADAEARCREVLARDPGYVGAWDVLTDALHYQHRWIDVVDAATRGIACEEATAYDTARFAGFRARAHLELGNHEALEDDLRGLGLGNRLEQSRAWMLRAMQMLRRGDLEQALAIATERLASDFGPKRVELVAVRFEAAHRLGRPEAAGTLTERDLERLRNLGHGPWVDRLVAEIVPR